jgi:hypothetical protein
VSFLVLRGADFHVVNLDEHPELRDDLERAVDRKLETPTIDIDGGHHVAPNLADLKELLEEAGLDAEAAPYHRCHPTA